MIAQELVHAPKLDPSGTSWLPFPFWVTGAVMAVLGATLAVAKLVAVALGVASVLAIRVAAEWLTRDRASAFAGAALCAVIPWSVAGGVARARAPAAACAFVALASLAPGATGGSISGAASPLLSATLSRYEPWFVALGFTAVLALTSLRERRVPPLRALAVLVALAGPVAWSLWNHHAHGYALHYLDRVAAYRQAVDQGELAGRAFDYVFAVFRAEPELLIVAAYLFVRERLGPKGTSPAARFATPAAVLAFVFVTLTASSVKGGAPTHHAERALLVVHLTIAVATGALLVHAIRHQILGRPLVLLPIVAVLIPGLYILRSWFLYKETFAKRADEVAIGAEVARVVPADERVLVEVIDYGFYAIEAGSRAAVVVRALRQGAARQGRPPGKLEALAARAAKASGTSSRPPGSRRAGSPS
ncbi:MAG: hypothetical protein IPM79_23860 [Polyangiaceae bacterium]|nr:hypothetical protein [Polyangiaceae bacterium]